PDTPVAPTPAPEAPQVAVCMSNPTNQTISYTMRVNSSNEDHTLEPGKALITWAHADPPDFVLSFDDSFEDGYTPRTIHLPAVQVAGTPDTCTDEMTYEFVLDGKSIGLQPRKWMPGFEHPFMPNVLRSDKEGEWHCAPGSRWASNDPNSL